MNKTKNIIQTGDEKHISDPLALCETEFSYEEIMQSLSEDNIAKKQICVLKLNTIKSQQDAFLLANNLCGQNGKIREVVAFKLCEFLNTQNLNSYFQSDEIIEIISNAICDINPNVAKLVCENISLFDNKKLLSTKISEKLFHLLTELNSFTGQKSHKLNKKLFNIYWLLQGTYVIKEYFNEKELTEILLNSYLIPDYPIREKTAQIVANINFCNETTSMIKEILQTDENYYIRQQFI